MLIRRGQLIIWPRLMKVSVLFCLHVDGLIEACTLAVKVSSVTQTQRSSYLDICGDICGIMHYRAPFLNPNHRN